MIRIICTAILGLVMFFPVANAEEKSLNIISCRSGTVTMLSASAEVTVYSYDFKGIDQGAKGDKTWDNFTHRCMGITRIMGGETLAKGYCKYMDPDGDFFMVAYDGLMGDKPLPWEFIQGTGKWKGIKGGGTTIGITRGKPIVEGTYQGCIEITGKYELPKYSSELELGNILMKAHEAKQKIPVVSAHNPNLDVKGAYRVQKAYVEQRLSRDQIAGFKAGLCTKAAQKSFGLYAPAAGVLFASGKNTVSPIIEKSAFKRLLVETEIGFMVAKPITQPLKDVSELYGYIQTVMPVIELPDVGFAGKPRGVDIIAGNVASAQFIAGKEREFRGIDLNSIFVTLTLDGEVVNIGRGTDSMEDQWKAALWLINNIVEQGWKIEPGQIFITGALPKAIPGKPGKYVADFERLGKISFEIK